MGYYKSKSYNKRRRSTGRKLSDEQIMKMQEGRERAKKERERVKNERENAAKTRERVEMMADLDARLAAGRREAAHGSNVSVRSHRRRRSYG